MKGILPSDAKALGVECIWTFTGDKEHHSGRLAIASILRAEIEGVKRLAVLVCAPGEMADDARREVAASIGNGGTRIDYHEDSFAW